MSVGYEYTPSTEEQRKELMDIFATVHPVKNVLEYFLMYQSSGLYGVTIDKFFILIGNGRNGKGFFSELMANTIGEYFYEANIAILQEGKKRGLMKS